MDDDIPEPIRLTMERPKPPMNRIMRSTEIICKHCGSDIVREHKTWFIFWSKYTDLGCLDPSCENYYRKAKL